MPQSKDQAFYGTNKYAVLIQISAPVTVTVNIPYAQYGFELTSPAGTFLSGRDPQFAFFRDTDLAGTWWVGCEDLNVSGSSDKDYNDLVLKVSTVPIPPSVLLLGSGLLGLLALGRTRRNR